MNAEQEDVRDIPLEQLLPREHSWADEAHIGIPNSERK